MIGLLSTLNLQVGLNLVQDPCMCEQSCTVQHSPSQLLEAACMCIPLHTVATLSPSEKIVIWRGLPVLGSQPQQPPRMPVSNKRPSTFTTGVLNLEDRRIVKKD